VFIDARMEFGTDYCTGDVPETIWDGLRRRTGR